MTGTTTTEIVVAGVGGEYMESVVVLEWLALPGAAVTAGQPVVVVETAKSATEIAAPAQGILSEIRAEAGTEVPVGGVLGLVAGTASVPAASPAAADEAVVATAPAPAADSRRAAAGALRLRISPAARRAARRRGVDPTGIVPSSPSGRIKLRDLPGQVQAAAARRLHARVRLGTAGPPLVLLHGFGADGSSWNLLLARTKFDRTTIAIDLPSHGGSPIGPARDVSAIARDVIAYLESEGLTEIHLAGHSLGGAVALAIASALAEEGRIQLRSLALLAPAGLGPEINSAFLSGLARASEPATLAPWLRQMVADASSIDAAFADLAMQARRDPAMREAQAAMLRVLFPDDTQVGDQRAALARIEAPVKIIWGLADRVIPSRHALGLSGKEALHLLPGVGHLPQLEAPVLVGRLLDELVRSAWGVP